MQDSKNEISLKIRNFLDREPIFNSQLPDQYTDEQDLFRLGVLDSLGLITLITFLEENFEISVTNRDLSELNFKSISAMTNFVQIKKA